ncbi:hypothetical protein BC829DRAFT_447493 [Chytridium lagenaria]|nr:hypothetical protein BC829DRAFT_447493 [Chytridium lagenaria]
MHPPFSTTTNAKLLTSLIDLHSRTVFRDLLGRDDEDCSIQAIQHSAKRLSMNLEDAACQDQAFTETLKLVQSLTRRLCAKYDCDDDLLPRNGTDGELSPNDAENRVTENSDATLDAGAFSNVGDEMRGSNNNISTMNLTSTKINEMQAVVQTQPFDSSHLALGSSSPSLPIARTDRGDALCLPTNHSNVAMSVEALLCKIFSSPICLPKESRSNNSIIPKHSSAISVPFASGSSSPTFSIEIPDRAHPALLCKIFSSPICLPKESRSNNSIIPKHSSAVSVPFASGSSSLSFSIEIPDRAHNRLTTNYSSVTPSVEALLCKNFSSPICLPKESRSNNSIIPKHSSAISIPLASGSSSPSPNIHLLSPNSISANIDAILYEILASPARVLDEVLDLIRAASFATSRSSSIDQDVVLEPSRLLELGDNFDEMGPLENGSMEALITQSRARKVVFDPILVTVWERWNAGGKNLVLAVILMARNGVVVDGGFAGDFIV